MYATCNSTINKKHKKNYEKVFCIFRNNFICFVFIIIYNILDAILPTKEEIVLYLCWKYELDYKNGIIRFIHYNGKKRNVNIKDIYTIRGRVFHSYVCEGAFSDSDKI